MQGETTVMASTGVFCALVDELLDECCLVSCDTESINV